MGGDRDSELAPDPLFSLLAHFFFFSFKDLTNAVFLKSWGRNIDSGILESDGCNDGFFMIDYDKPAGPRIIKICIIFSTELSFIGSG